MSKLYRGTFYINENGNNFGDIESIKDSLERDYNLHFYFTDVEVRDTTKYLEEVEDGYPWNTINDEKAVKEINEYFENYKSARDWFEELGFEFEREGDVYRYIKLSKDEPRCYEIVFNDSIQEIFCNTVLYGVKMPTSLNIPLINAIETQCIELGWYN